MSRVQTLFNHFPTKRSVDSYDNNNKKKEKHSYKSELDLLSYNNYNKKDKPCHMHRLVTFSNWFHT